MTNSESLFAAYIPVIHEGYIEALSRHPDAVVGIFDQSVTDLVPYLRKDIRALSPEAAETLIQSLGRQTVIVDLEALEQALRTKYVIMPSDDLTDAIEEQYPDTKIEREPIFLRWDRNAATSNVDVTTDRTVTLPSDHPVIAEIYHEKSASSNWWRHIGAVCTDMKGSVLLSTHNSPLPTQHSSWIDSDPRITSRRGESIERSIDIHAEAWLIARAAQKGLSLEGTELYVSTFPCPNCAKLIANCGVKACYFVEGYAMLDGFDILKSADIEIVKIEVPDEAAEDPRTLKPYA